MNIWFVVNKEGAESICTLGPDGPLPADRSISLKPPYTVVRVATEQESDWAEDCIDDSELQYDLDHEEDL